jgi:acyl-CoA synthetase (NDP forming)
MIDPNIDFSTIEKIFKAATFESLLEHEVYAVLMAMGIATPRFHYLLKDQTVVDAELSFFTSDELVIKIVSPQIQHKTDVGGVRFVVKDASAVNQTISEMMENIPENYAEAIQGCLILEKIPFTAAGLGSELLLGLRNSREFGPVVSLAAGGTEVELLNKQLKAGSALAISSSHLLPHPDIGKVLESLAFFDRLTSEFRGHPPLLDRAVLEDMYSRFLRLGAYFSPAAAHSEFVIEEMEVNPFVLYQDRLFPLDGLCRISKQCPDRRNVPIKQVRHLLDPDSIGIIGVSEKMNIGHIILNNILKQGFDREKVYVIKPGQEEIEGCRCLPTVKELPAAVDLFVLTVSAEQSLQVMRDLVDCGNARSVIIIAGGMGEKEGTQDIEHGIRRLLATSRDAGKMVPVVNGGNSMGIYSHPGKYDTTFVPEHKIYTLPRKDLHRPGLVYLSQSGAFMASRLSQLPGLAPQYAVSIGNQIDLTLSDYMHYLKDDPLAKIFALYIEGFRPGDGLALAAAAQEITSQDGKAVVAYKAGRSPEGQAATASHTASVAGEYQVSRAVLEQAGVFVAQDIDEFEDAVKSLCFLAGKKIRGNRVALISNAGFECVIMSDNLRGEQQLELAELSSETKDKLTEILQPLGIDRLQDVRNPLDATPVADDATFCACVEILLQDPGVDCAVVSPLPMSPAMNTLAPGDLHREDLNREGSTPRRLAELSSRTDKPFLVSIDSGTLYLPMRQLLETAGIPVFRRCDLAVKFLRKFVHGHLR